MKHLEFIFYFFLLLTSSAIAQNDAKEVKIEDNTHIKKFGYTDQGVFYTFEHIKGTDFKIRFRAWDTNFNLLNTITHNDKIEDHHFLFSSPKGSSFVFDDKNYKLYLAGKDNINFDDLSLKEFEIYQHFLTEKKFIKLGQLILGKKTKLSWNSLLEFEKVYSDELIILTKNLDNGQLSLTELERLEGCFLNAMDTKVLYFDEDIFIVSYLFKTNRMERTYKVVTYNYSGKIIKNLKIDIAVNDPDKEKFAVVNLENGSFDMFRTSTYSGFGNSLGSTDVDTNYFANSNSMGNIKYDVLEKCFYVYTGILPNRGDSSILIEKYNENGELVWRNQQVLENTSLHLINSLNRYLTFDIYPKFIGVSIYSTKGKDYCDFYIFDKKSGTLIKSEKFDKYGFFKKSGNYNSLDVEYEINNKNFNNLGLDRSIIFTALYNQKFKDFLINLNNKGSYLIMGHYSDDALNLVISAKKENRILFQKFKF